MLTVSRQHSVISQKEGGGTLSCGNCRDGLDLSLFLLKAESRSLNASQEDPRAKLVCTVSFGSEFWQVISPRKRPAGLRPFMAIEANGRSAPNTGGDVLFHILSKRHDLNFELAMRIRNQLGDTVEVMNEVHGFQYLDSRDLTGFIDGTENPKGKERAPVAVIGAEDPAFAGGSYVFTQRPAQAGQQGTFRQDETSDRPYQPGRHREEGRRIRDCPAQLSLWNGVRIRPLLHRLHEDLGHPREDAESHDGYHGRRSARPLDGLHPSGVGCDILRAVTGSAQTS